MSKLSLVGLSKADVLAALYNASKPQGMGFMQYDPKPMTSAEAEALLKQSTYFDYLKGRVMKVSLEGDEFETWGYDRDNGQGAAERAIASLRQTGDANSSSIRETHRTETLHSAQRTKGHLGDKTRMEDGVMHLGLDDVAEPLNAAVDTAIKQQ